MAEPLFALTDNQTWPAQGQWTYEDYLRLPDDNRRYEIIEGVLYVAKAPGFEYQFTVTEIIGELRNFVKQHQLGLILAAPFEVHLSEATRPVQPDLIFVRTNRRAAFDAQVFKGAPDLLVEVLSPGSIRTDRHIKFDAYERAGVTEYWIVNPKTRSVEVYTLSGGEYALLGEFTGTETINSIVLAGINLITYTLFSGETA